MSEVERKHFGLLAYLSEANEIHQTEGCPFDEALALQRQRAAEREREAELAHAESNVIPFRRKH